MMPSADKAMTAGPDLVHDCEDMIRLFNQLFAETCNCVLIRGDDEPVYLPADDADPRNRIIFAHGFFASTLHEISHWCVAGPERRKLEDFGYWYEPDGRTAEQQAAFEVVEVKPQALEWILAKACGFRFRVSADNLSGVPTDSSRFKADVLRQTGIYLREGLAERPRMLVETLAAFYQQPVPQPEHFSLAELG